MGALGDPAALPVLRRLCSDPVQEVAETCQLAVGRLEWLQKKQVSPGCCMHGPSVPPIDP